MCENSTILIAAGFSWPMYVFFAVLMLLWILGKVVGGNVAKPPNKRPPGPMPRRPPPGPANEQLKGEIEEFLRRVSTAQKEQPGQQRGQARQPQPAKRPGPPTSAPTRRQRPAPIVVVAKGGGPVAVQNLDEPSTPQQIEQYVKKHLDTREFKQRSDHLTSIDEKEKQFERQVQQTFAHEVGHLKPSVLAARADAPQASDAAPQVVDSGAKNRLTAWLASGPHLKQAIILNEILQRPEHRW